MVIHRPDFVVVGAMKSATTTLHEQLARQRGVFMSRPKEPNFFSDDAIYARGWEWYSSLFSAAGEGVLRGESSTHYTKLPTFPRTVERMIRGLPSVKLIYVMRHPIDRLMSQYIHELTAGGIRVGLREAVDRYPELIDYSRYAMQLEPFLTAYGPKSVLPVFFPRLISKSQQELERIGRFLEVPGPMKWDFSLRPQNSRRDRLRPSPIRQSLLQAPVLRSLRQRVVPRRWSQSAKRFLRARMAPPVVPPDLTVQLREIFDADLSQLGSWLGIKLDCADFNSVTAEQPHLWAVSGFSPRRASLSP
jgi:sulfotransferase family protein